MTGTQSVTYSFYLGQETLLGILFTQDRPQLMRKNPSCPLNWD